MSKYIILTWSDCTDFSDISIIWDSTGLSLIFPSVQEAEWYAKEHVAGEYTVVKIN